MHSITPDASRHLSVEAVAALFDGEICAPESVDPAALTIRGVGSLEDAVAETVSFCVAEKYLDAVRQTRASAVIIHPTLALPPGELRETVQILTPEPDYAFALVAATLLQEETPTEPGVHPTAVVHETAILGEGVSVGPHCTVGAQAEVGDGTRLEAGVVIAFKARVGAHCHLHAGVVVRERCVLGDRIVAQPNAVIGSDGFGYARFPEGWRKIPQLGIAVLEDDVEIGACTCVDRARFDRTVLHRDVKLDNLVQIAHNCTVGEHTAMAAQVGLSGTTTIGSNCMFGGQVGFAGHQRIGDQAMIGGQAGVVGDKEGHAQYIGSPAIPQKEFWRQQAALARLPDLLKTVRALTNRVADLEARQHDGGAVPPSEESP